jgi:hypothetical protein
LELASSSNARSRRAFDMKDSTKADSCVFMPALYTQTEVATQLLVEIRRQRKFAPSAPLSAIGIFQRNRNFSPVGSVM